MSGVLNKTSRQFFTSDARVIVHRSMRRHHSLGLVSTLMSVLQQRQTPCCEIFGLQVLIQLPAHTNSLPLGLCSLSKRQWRRTACIETLSLHWKALWHHTYENPDTQSSGNTQNRAHMTKCFFSRSLLSWKVSCERASTQSFQPTHYSSLRPLPWLAELKCYVNKLSIGVECS